MIAKLVGLIDSRGDDYVVLDVGGVGYLVFCSVRTLGRLPMAGQAIGLLIETQVREDAINLYGFHDAADRDWFRNLTSVQGVGAKVALSVLSVLSPEQILTAIAAQDKAALGRAPGVGPKLAARLLTELKDKVGTVALGRAAPGGRVAAASAVTAMADGVAPTVVEDAVSALVNLGYGRSEAFTVVARLVRQDGAGDVQTLVRAALKEFGQMAGT